MASREIAFTIPAPPSTWDAAALELTLTPGPNGIATTCDAAECLYFVIPYTKHTLPISQ